MTVAHSPGAAPVLELRRYTLHPGRLADLLAVFETHLVEPQEDAGMGVLGTFVDEDDPDVFTWMREFPGHEARTASLRAFYGGPVWARHAAAANATMVDSDDVLLLRPTAPPYAPAAPAPRGRPGAVPSQDGVLVGCHGLDTDAAATEAWFAQVAVPGLEDALGAQVAAWRSDPTPNGFPRLPVRDEPALVWMAVLPDRVARDEAYAALEEAPVWRVLGERTSWRRVSRLRPTARSAHPVAAPPRVRRAPERGGESRQ